MYLVDPSDGMAYISTIGHEWKSSYVKSGLMHHEQAPCYMSGRVSWTKPDCEWQGFAVAQLDTKEKYCAVVELGLAKGKVTVDYWIT